MVMVDVMLDVMVDGRCWLRIAAMRLPPIRYSARKFDPESIAQVYEL